MRALFFASASLFVVGCHLSHSDYTVVPGDAAHDVPFGDSVGFDGELPDGSTEDSPTGFDGPPPVDDTGIDDFGGPPPAGSHLEAVIDATGGTLLGASGTPLAGVKLIVPAGALSTSTTIALDFQSILPPSPKEGTPITPYVSVGPAGLAFAVPARLTLPWTITPTAPDLVVLARVGATWSALLEPLGDVAGRTITGSMRRASSAQGFAFTSSAAPSLTSFSPTAAAAGDPIFVGGTGFGVAPAWSMPDDAGTSTISGVTVGGAPVTTLAWSDTSISIVAPDAGGTITVTTPSGSATSDAGVAITP